MRGAALVLGAALLAGHAGAATPDPVLSLALALGAVPAGPDGLCDNPRAAALRLDDQPGAPVLCITIRQLNLLIQIYSHEGRPA